MSTLIDRVQASTALAPLIHMPMWGLWRYEPAKNGRATKIPYSPRDPAKKARVNNDKTFASFDLAAAAFERGGFDGVNFLLSGDLIGAFDLDHCLGDTGEPTDWAKRLADECRSYVEITPSGQGLRIIGYCRPGRRQHHAVHCKIPAPDGASVESFRRTNKCIAITASPPNGYDKS